MTKRYGVVEIFYSLQGEGHRKGSANVFVRFTGCNLRCNLAEHGFDCDTDFSKGDMMTSDEIVGAVVEQWHTYVDTGTPDCRRWVIATGGEPTLQLDAELIGKLHQRGFRVAIETNGTRVVPSGVDYIAVSPKGEQIVSKADEVRYVIGTEGGFLPPIDARHYFVSPAFDVKTGVPVPRAIDRCIALCLEHPRYRLSMQDHKLWGVR